MPTVIKTANKDLNPDRLHDELLLAGIEPEGIFWAGFKRISNRLQVPEEQTSTSTGQPDTVYPAGELHLRYASDPGVSLDTLLAAHDATLLSRAQTNTKADKDAVPALINAYQNWDTLTDNQKDNVLKNLVRLVARNEDSSQDL